MHECFYNVHYIYTCTYNMNLYNYDHAYDDNNKIQRNKRLTGSNTTSSRQFAFININSSKNLNS